MRYLEQAVGATLGRHDHCLIEQFVVLRARHPWLARRGFTVPDRLRSVDDRAWSAAKVTTRPAGRITNAVGPCAALAPS